MQTISYRKLVRSLRRNKTDIYVEAGRAKGSHRLLVPATHAEGHHREVQADSKHFRPITASRVQGPQCTRLRRLASADKFVGFRVHPAGEPLAGLWSLFQTV